MNDRANDRPGVVMMYHYVRPDAETVSAGIRPMRVGEFERQLDWLGERYAVVRPAEFLAWLAGEATFDRPPCLLTFDDGTQDHATVVTPILARRGWGGVFFVLSGPAEEGVMPLTHAVHWLLGRPDEATWAVFERYAREELGGVEALGDPAEARRIYHYEPELRARIKYAANMAMPAPATGAIVARAAAAEGLSLADLAAEWFVSEGQIGEMHRAGMTIGLHGHSHSSLQVLGEEGIAREIEHGSAYLERVTGRRPTWWACPFGGTGASEAAHAAMRGAMREVGLIAGVGTVKTPVIRRCDRTALPRYDCIDLPPRKQSPPAELGVA